MKKLIYFASMVLFCACQNSEELLDHDNGTDGLSSAVTVNFTLPEGLQSRATRAYGEGKEIKHIKWAVYKSTSEGQNNSTPGDKVTSGTYTFKTEDLGKMEGRFIIEKLAVGETYDFVFWAENDNSGYTFNEDNATVSMNYTGSSNRSGATCNDEKRDAFFCSKRGILITRGLELTATLYRPFAQLNILTDDLPDSDTSTYWVQMGGENFCNTLNLLDGSAKTEGGSGTPNFLAAVASTETMTINSKSYRVIAMNYILMDGRQNDSDPSYIDAGDTYKKTYTVQLYKGNDNDKSKPMLGTNGIVSVPFKRNYRTNIYGSLLSTNASINYKIQPSFNSPDMSSTLTATTQEELQKEIANATTGSVITLLADIELTSQLVVNEAKNITIDLNGNDIKGDATYTNASLVLLNNENATLTFEDTNPSGEGNLGLGIAEYVVAVEKGNLVLKSGNYKGKKGCVKWISSSSDGVSRATSPTIHIEDGVYSAVERTEGEYRLLDFDCQVPNGVGEWSTNNVRNFIVYGGRFQSFNPSSAVINGYPTWNFLPSNEEYPQSTADQPGSKNSSYAVTEDSATGFYTVTYTAPAN